MTPPLNPAAARDRLPSLTGLRFWAALLVVGYHLSRQVGKLPWIGEATYYGRSGVTFFFVLSGFVLAWTYQGAMVRTGVFLWRRCARIVPLHLLTAALSLGVYLALGMAFSLRASLASVFFLYSWFPPLVREVAGNPAAWSLSDEAWFYLVFPLALLLLARAGRRRRAWIAAALMVGSVLVWIAGSQLAESPGRVWLLDYFPVSRSLQFLLGVVAGLAMKAGLLRRVPLLPAALLVVGFHLALIPWSHAVSDGAWYGSYAISEALSGPVFALLIVAAAGSDLRGARTGLAGTWMVRLGQWSFAWYLVHEIGIRIAVHTIGTPKGLLATGAMWVGLIVVTQAFAGLLYHWVEHPAERRLRRMLPVRPAGNPAGAAPERAVVTPVG